MNDCRVHQSRRRPRLHLFFLIVVPLLWYPAVVSFTSRPTYLHELRLPPLQNSVVTSFLLKKKSSLTAPSKRAAPISSVITVDLLNGATREAMHRQRRILEALDEQEEKLQKTDGEEEIANVMSSLNRRREEIGDKIRGLDDLLCETEELARTRRSGDLQTLMELKAKLLGMGFQSILAQGEGSWRHIAEEERSAREFGRPADFTGLVFETPCGVPVLVGREEAHGDGVLRRVAQGSDLWFQVEDYAGARVLLRTSLARGTKNSRSCRQFAADLAAYYSRYRDWRSVSVMYTDSRRVAKRGSKAGQMRRSKSLGRVKANPIDVAYVAAGKETP